MCEMCRQIAVWEPEIVGHDESGEHSHPIWEGEMIYPGSGSVPLPTEDMPEKLE